MRRIEISLSLMTLVAMVVVSVAARQSSSEKPASAAAMQAPQPGPEMVKLQKFYLGTWDYTETYPKGPFAPEGGVNTGVYKSELVPGGFSLINHFHSQGPVGDFEGLLILTWEPKDKAYKSYIFGNDFPGGIVETGNFEGDALVFRGELTTGAGEDFHAQQRTDWRKRKDDERRIHSRRRVGTFAGACFGDAQALVADSVRATFRLQAFEDAGGAHATAYAHCDHAVAGVAAF